MGHAISEKIFSGRKSIKQHKTENSGKINLTLSNLKSEDRDAYEE